jgi:hypothetical protein
MRFPTRASGASSHRLTEIHRVGAHQTATPSLGRRTWHCFGCGAGGNALDLYLAVTRLPVYEAALELCARLHLAVPRRVTPLCQRAARRPP